MQLNNNIQEKIKSVYNKKNYKNIERFPILKHQNNLEGFAGKTSNPANGGPSMKDYWNATGDIFTGDSKKKSKDKNKVDNIEVEENKDEPTTFGNIKAGANQFKELMNDQYKTTSDSTTNLYNSISSANLPNLLTNTDNIKVAGESIKKFITGDNKEISIGGESDKMKIAKNMILLPINFINNTILYFCIVITQLSYTAPPIGPWGNIFNTLDTPNWPWKLDLDVSPSDNLALDANAKLYDPSGASVPVKGGNIPAETYYENQKILYDSNILFGVFTQIILVCVTWVMTNNAYYYMFVITPELPYRIIEPFSTIDNKIEVERGIGAIVYTIVNTIICTPYDVITWTLHMLRIIEFSKSSPFYGFRELTYILLFLIILYFVLTYFWDMYNSILEDFFSFKYEPFYFIFIIYGLVYHYLFIKIVDEKHKVVPGNWYIKKGLSLMTIMSAFGGGYPVVRIMFFFWAIFIFFGLQGFGTDTYDDIYKMRSKDDCESNKFSLLKFIKKVVVFIFPYFFSLVMFVLLLSNLMYLNSQPTLNSNSSSAMKIIVAFIFIIIFLFFIFSILNKYILTDNKTVIFGKSFLNEKNELDNIINKSTTMKTYPASLETDKKEGESSELSSLKTKGLSVFNKIKSSLTPDLGKAPPPVPIEQIENSDNPLDKFNIKVKKLIKSLSSDDILPTNPDAAIEKKYQEDRIAIKEFVEILKNVEEFFDDSYIKELWPKGEKYYDIFDIRSNFDKVYTEHQGNIFKKFGSSPRIRKYFNNVTLWLKDIGVEGSMYLGKINKFLEIIAKLPYPSTKNEVSETPESKKNEVSETPDTSVENNETKGGNNEEPKKEDNSEKNEEPKKEDNSENNEESKKEDNSENNEESKKEDDNTDTLLTYYQPEDDESPKLKYSDPEILKYFRIIKYNLDQAIGRDKYRKDRAIARNPTKRFLGKSLDILLKIVHIYNSKILEKYFNEGEPIIGIMSIILTDLFLRKIDPYNLAEKINIF